MRRLAIVFVACMAVAVVAAFYRVVIPDIRARAAEDAKDRGVRVELTDQGDPADALIGSSCQQAVVGTEPRLAKMPGIIGQESAGLRMDYVDTASSTAWTFLCTSGDHGPVLRQIDARRSADNPRGWVRNGDGSMTMLDQAGRPMTVSGGTLSFDGPPS